MNATGFLLLIFLHLSIYINPDTEKESTLEQETKSNYELLGDNKPSKEAYTMALEGYNQIKQEFSLDDNKTYLTIIDFTLPSSKKRLWVIDMFSNQVVYNTYVAHGRNTGDLTAEYFSNVAQSYKSSLGFYITGKTYHGKNGYSLYLDGLEPGINDKARERAIVMHGAWYANEVMIKKFGRLGRSYGCPSIPEHIHKELIDAISEETVLFIYHSSQEYLETSRFF